MPLLGFAGLVPVPALRAVEAGELWDLHAVKLIKSLHQFWVPAQQVKRMCQLSNTVGKIIFRFAEELTCEVDNLRPAKERLNHCGIVLLRASLCLLQRQIVGADDEDGVLEALLVLLEEVRPNHGPFALEELFRLVDLPLRESVFAGELLAGDQLLLDVGQVAFALGQVLGTPIHFY